LGESGVEDGAKKLPKARAKKIEAKNGVKTKKRRMK
jgi:hypothetical protein